jgi:hypothetical protein
MPMRERKNVNLDTKKIKFLLVILFIIVVISMLFAAKFIFEKPRSVTDYPMEIHVVIDQNEVGFDAGPKLNFGWIGPGSSAMRFVDLGNPGQNARVKLTASGDFAKWVSVSENNFVIKTGEKKELTLTATVSADAKPGNYTANLRIEFYNSIF